MTSMLPRTSPTCDAKTAIQGTFVQLAQVRVQRGPQCLRVWPGQVRASHTWELVHVHLLPRKSTVTGVPQRLCWPQSISLHIISIQGLRFGMLQPARTHQGVSMPPPATQATCPC